ncbi:hypothetical protein E4U41_003228 [Claviceps citrina]|nr:hypothetical protein E4U41_003228 [Claviceps citrina]
MAGALFSSQPLSETAELVAPAGNNSRRLKEEQDKVLAKMADQSFNPKKYHDPLLPRQGVDPRLYRPGVTSQMEKEWLNKIAAMKEARR